MSLAAEHKTITVALLGNPNTGKSTLFTALCGVRQRTGNYPGVTVEKKTGRMAQAGQSFEVIDLPGTYSLAPRSPDEMIAVDVLLGRRADTHRVDVVVCIVDASNLERNLYLVSQILEIGLPVVIALNMVDLAGAKGVKIDVAQLQARLGLPVVSIQANKRIGIDRLRRAIDRAVSSPAIPPESPFPAPFQQEIQRLERLAPDLPRYLVERLLLDTSGYLVKVVAGLSTEPRQRHGQETGRNRTTDDLLEEVNHSRARLAAANCSVPAVEAISRYKWVAGLLDGIVQRAARRQTLSDRVDRLLTHRIWGTLVFVAVMVAMFASVFSLAAYPMTWINDGMSLLGQLVEGSMSPGALRSLLVDGVIAGVGGVVVFLPQILILFFFIGALEDCGYMARAAYLMDKLMSRVGLSGKSFIPLLSSFACAIPGIMGTRVIENSRDRLVTILVAPLMSCSARLPVYTLLAVVFIPEMYLFATSWFAGIGVVRPLVVASMYFLGIVAAALVALLLKRTILRGSTPPFVLELPMYKLPSLSGVLLRAMERGWTFIKSAGTLILAISILIWAAAYYPRRDEAVPTELKAQHSDLVGQLESFTSDSPQRLPLEEKLSEVENQIEGAYLADSYLGRAGHVMEPVVQPLGWDWRIGAAAIASFPAREVVVATLGVIFSLGGEVDEADEGLHGALRNARWPDGRPLFNLPVALSLMVFFALCAQCASTLVTIRRETNSWRWPAFTFVYMTVLAYLAALVTYQVGAWLIS